MSAAMDAAPLFSAMMDPRESAHHELRTGYLTEDLKKALAVPLPGLAVQLDDGPATTAPTGPSRPRSRPPA